MNRTGFSGATSAGIIPRYHARYTFVVNTNTGICCSTPLTSMENSPNIYEPLLFQENEYPEKPPLHRCEFRI